MAMELACEDVSNEFYTLWDSNKQSEETIRNSLTEIQDEVKVAETALSELTPGVKALHRKLIWARIFLSRSSFRQCPQMKKLLFQLEALQPYVTEMKSDVTEITRDIRAVLTGSEVEPHPVTLDWAYVTEATRVVKALPKVGPNQTDVTELSRDLKAVLTDNEADPDPITSHWILAPEVSEEAGDQVGVSVGPHVLSNGSEEKMRSSSQSAHVLGVKESECEPCECIACQQKELYESTVLPTLPHIPSPPQAKEVKTKCYICCMMVSNRDLHMQEFHPGQKPFPCDQCPMAFDDFKDLKKHLLAHKKMTLKEHKSNISRRRLKKEKTFEEHKANFSQKHSNKSEGKRWKECPICHLRISNERRHMGEFHPEQKVYSCKRCPMKFDKHEDLRKHRLVHKVTAFKCDLCNKVYSRRRDLAEHLEAHLNEKPIYICHVCGKVFTSKSSLRKCKHGLITKVPVQSSQMHLDLHCNDSDEKQNHITIQHKRRLLNCPFCSKTFTEQKSLDQHLNVHNGKKPFACGVCGEKFPSLSSKWNHKYRTHIQGLQYFKCVICLDIGFKSKYVRETHYLTAHTQEELNSHGIIVERIKCSECGKLIRKENLKRHMETHSAKEKSFVCEICGKKFKNLVGLRGHILCYHEREEKTSDQAGSHVCDICGKSYSFYSYLEQHKLVHDKYEMIDGSYVCDVCGKKCNSKSSLYAHKFKHAPNQGKVHFCDICGKGFAQKSAWKYHYAIHTGDKPFKCAVCGKGFITKRLLQCHDVVHTKEKPFSCEVCGMSFSSHPNRVRHMSRHTGIKPYECDFCGKAFAQKTVMQVHRRIHTGEKPHKCVTCNKSFSDPSTLAKHKGTHSGNTRPNTLSSISSSNNNNIQETIVLVLDGMI